MEKDCNFKNGLLRIGDCAGSIGEKMRCTADLLEVVYAGAKALNKSDDLYGLPCLMVISDYIKSINGNDMEELLGLVEALSQSCDSL